MKLNGVSFIFDKSELPVLLRLLGCENILFPSLEDVIDFEAALEQLRENQMISGSREALAVDQVIAFLLLTMNGADFCLYISGGGYIAIFKAALASIVLQKRGERWLVTPFQTFAGARTFLLKSLGRLQAPCLLTVRGKERTETMHFEITEAVITAVEELLPVEEEEAKKKWKP